MSSFLLQGMKTNHCVKPLLMSSWVKSTRTWWKRKYQCGDSWNDSLGCYSKLICTFPRRPLCLESRLPLFFTATSRVLLWSSMRETVNSNLGERRRRAFSRQQTPGTYESAQRCSRLVVNRVQVPLECGSFPPAWPPFVREEVEADVRVRAVVGEGDQVPAEAETRASAQQNKLISAPK